MIGVSSGPQAYLQTLRHLPQLRKWAMKAPLNVIFRAATVKEALGDWCASGGRAIEERIAACKEHLAEWAGGHFNAQIVIVENARRDGDVLVLLLSSDGWHGSKEVVLLPDGSLAW